MRKLQRNSGVMGARGRCGIQPSHRSSDRQMLFLANMLSKMKHNTPLGSRIAEVHNGSTPALRPIIENYAQIVERKDTKTGKVKRDQRFPRFHQLDVVRKLLADAKTEGAGRRVLIQHCAGSGKSNSIAWLAHQLVRLAHDTGQVFDSVIGVTDRRILDQRIGDTIKQFAQVGATAGHAEHSGDLRRFLADGKKITITTVQKFPFILDDIGSQHRERSFAMIIDEAHSSQGGKAAAALNAALTGEDDGEDEETVEDKINAIMEQRKMLPNVRYFAFTATPKNKTLEIFGQPLTEGDTIKHRLLRC